MLTMNLNKEQYDEMVAYTEEMIQQHKEICKAIDDEKDRNQNHLNSILWEAENESQNANFKRPQSTFITPDYVQSRASKRLSLSSFLTTSPPVKSTFHKLSFKLKD